jgi:hypothetical protein
MIIFLKYQARVRNAKARLVPAKNGRTWAVRHLKAETRQATSSSGVK